VLDPFEPAAELAPPLAAPGEPLDPPEPPVDPEPVGPPPGYCTPGGPEAVSLGAALMTPVGLALEPGPPCPPFAPALFVGVPVVPVQAYATKPIRNNGIPSNTARRRQ
jgi:hypothetical protein